jgi:hypothetical protein
LSHHVRVAANQKHERRKPLAIGRSTSTSGEPAAIGPAAPMLEDFSHWAKDNTEGPDAPIRARGMHEETAWRSSNDGKDTATPFWIDGEPTWTSWNESSRVKYGRIARASAAVSCVA